MSSTAASVGVPPTAAVGCSAADVGAEPQRAAAEQAAVLGEQHAALGAGLLDQGVVVAVVGVGGVDPGQPESAGQRAQVHVEHEPRRGQRLRPPHGSDCHDLPAGQPARRRR